ncbi:MAG TPA: penicillin-binding protein 2 [Candidatus Moranbacteria bacterium]|nr:MAG: Cell elongation specific D,D-transpeptidase [Candidatus Moranbacteria bacterium GW2011_GWF1_34_10]HBI17288.1 penicillin-binding protein 2 [Candidatus Moranbacteria bacterium]
MRFFNKQYKLKTSKEIDEIADSVLLSGTEVGRIEVPFNKNLLNVFWLFIILSLVFLFSRTAFLAMVKGEHYRAVAKENRLRSTYIKAPRGKIFDRSGNVLVYNIPSLDLIMDIRGLQSGFEFSPEALEKIKKIFPDRYEEFLENLKNKNKAENSILLLENINQKEALLVMESYQKLPGIQVSKTAIRDYTDSLIFSNIIGYEGKIKKEELAENPEYLMTDSIGKKGLEKYYEKELRGVHGKINVEVDSMGHVVRELGIINPEAGSDLVLNIDSQLQKKIFDSLSGVLEKEELRAGAAVALDPRSGAVLAMVSIPSFDNNLFSKGISNEDYSNLLNNESKPMFNRAVSGEYAPGSTFKPVMASAALTEGVINSSTQIESKGGLSVGSWFFGDWKAHGFTDVKRALAVSSDVFFYSVGGGYGSIRGIGIENIKKYANLFGYGELSGVDIPGEVGGFIPTKEWKEEKFKENWYIGNTYHASIGQGYITATPLQIANSVSVVANGGTLYRPRLVSQIKKSDKTLYNKSEIIRSGFIAPDILKTVREGMRMTVTEGTAQLLKDLPVEVAGKTGTAQFGNEKKAHGWFVSFAPYENPEIVTVVLVEGQEEDGFNAVPVTNEVYKWYFSR